MNTDPKQEAGPIGAQLRVFFSLAFGISWLLWLPDILSSRGLSALPSLAPLATFGPAAAALILAGSGKGRQGVLALLRKLLSFRMPRRVGLVALLLPPAVSAAATWIYLERGGSVPPDFRDLSIPLSQPMSRWPLVIPAYFVFTLVFRGPLGEELGWRAYALPRLQRRWNPFWSSVILGTLWGLWHLPLFWIVGSVHQENLPLLVFLFSTIPLSVILTWLYNNNRAGVWTAILFHQMVNFSLELNPVVSARPQAFTWLTLLYTVAAGWVVWRSRRV